MTSRLKSITTLQWALGLSVLLHAALLAVRFVDPESIRRAFESTHLQVVLVNAQSDEKPEKAQALAQVNMAGGGEAQDKRLASTPMPASAIDAQGDAVVNENQRRLDAMLEQQELLLAQVREQLAKLPKRDPNQDADDPEARAQEERRQQLSKLLGAIEKRIEEENSRPRKRYLSPATLGVTYAEYYDAMRRKIEDEGTRRFPQAGGRKLYGELLMALLIHHDGTVKDSRVVQSSGNRTLDRMAEAIATSAAPFGKFTAAMRKDTDQFDVTARFKFTREQKLETTLEADALTTTVTQELN